MARLHVQAIEKIFDDGTRALDGISLDVKDGELVVLLGPSGCGKSTLLRVVAGLEQPTAGSVRLDEQDLLALPPQERGVAMVFQSYALYPHMTVQQNLEFPLRMANEKSESLRRRVQEVLERLDIEPLRYKRPRDLSGGQQQRVAMGRAMVRRPELYLLDEPLSNLDARLRARIRGEIAELQRELCVTTLYVTHDQVEAMTLGHRIAVLRNGRLLQFDVPDAVHDQPVNAFVADFVGPHGINLLRARVEDDRLAVVDGRGSFALKALEVEAGTPLVLGARPEAFRLVDVQSADALFAGQVRVVERMGPERLLRVTADVDLLGAEDPSRIDPERELLVRAAASEATAREGDTVGITVDPQRIHVFTTSGGALHHPSTLA